MRSFIMIAIVLATGCRGQIKSIDGTDVSTDTGTASTDTTTDTDVTTDTGTGTAEAPILDVDFTTAWSVAEPFKGTIGSEVNLGAINFMSEDQQMITVSLIVLSTWVDTDGDGVYNLDGEGVHARDYMTHCKLEDVTTRTVYAGPVDLANDNDEFTVGGEFSTTLNVVCTLTGTMPEGANYGFAVDLFHDDFVSNGMAVMAVADDSTAVQVKLGEENGVQSIRGRLTPDVAVLVAN